MARTSDLLRLETKAAYEVLQPDGSLIQEKPGQKPMFTESRVTPMALGASV
jgi:hypothetical protein